jgi:hypothetical protein
MTLTFRMFPLMNDDDGAGDGGKPTPEPAPAPKDDKTVPYDRFAQVNTALGAYKALGNADELAARLERLAAFEKDDEDRKKAQMTEVERLQKERDEAAGKLTAAEQRALELEKARENDRIEFAVLAAAKDAVDPEAVLAFLDRGALKVDDGKVVGVDEALAALKEKKPYLFAAPEPKKPKEIGGGNNPPKAGDKTAEQVLAELAEKARKSGRPEDRMAYAEAKAKLQK